MMILCNDAERREDKTSLCLHIPFRVPCIRWKDTMMPTQTALSRDFRTERIWDISVRTGNRCKRRRIYFLNTPSFRLILRTLNSFSEKQRHQKQTKSAYRPRTSRTMETNAGGVF